MAWIESHQTVWEHAKTRKAARRLGISTVQLVGHLHALWHWAVDHAEDGNVSKYDADDLAIAARWEGDPDEFVTALMECGAGDAAGFLEPGGQYGPPEDHRQAELVLHDWWSYAGKLIARRMKDRERKTARRSAGSPQDVPGNDPPKDDFHRTSAGSPQDGPPDSRYAGTVEPFTKDEDQDHGALVPFPTRTPANGTIASAIISWASAEDFNFDPPRKLSEIYAVCLDLAGSQVGPQHPSYKRLTLQLCSEYVAAVCEEPLTPGAKSHLNRIVGEFGAHAAMRGLQAAMSWGAGLDEKYAGDPLALTKYAQTVCQREAAA